MQFWKETPVATGDFALRFQKMKADIHRKIVEAIDLTKLGKWKPERLRREVQALAEEMSRATPELLNDLDRERLVKEILDEVFGLGPLEPLMNDPTISDILVNGPHEVFIEREGKLEETNIIFADNAHLMMFIQRIAARLGRRIDEMSPMVDARLPDGSRVNVIVPPLSLEGPVLSIRRFGTRLTPEKLLELGTLTPEMLDLLHACVLGRISMVISGGTGSGKTTLLNCLSRYIPTHERLVTIEDSAELMLQQKHVVRLETRPPNMEGAGEVRQRELVRNALRMRPDRIIVGEVRGPETLDMLQAMNTGHEGSLTTVHANDTADAMLRLEMMVMMTGFELPIPIIRQYISTAITIVLQLSRLHGGGRRLMRISEVVGTEAGAYVMHDLFVYKQTGVRHGRAIGEFHATGHVPTFLTRLQSSGIELKPEIFTQRILQRDDAPAAPKGNNA